MEGLEPFRDKFEVHYDEFRDVMIKQLARKKAGPDKNCSPRHPVSFF